MKVKGAFIVFILIVISSLACKSISNSSSLGNKYFEGQITYSKKYIPRVEGVDLSHLNYITGNKMVMVFKEGSFKQTVYGPNGIIVWEEELDLKENKFYHKRGDNKKVYWYYVTGNELSTIFHQKQDSIILTHPTTVIKITERHEENSDKIRRTPEEIHFAKDLKVNPKWYANYKLRNYYDQIKIGKGIELYSIKEGQWTQIIKAEKIERRKVKDYEIKIDHENSEEFVEAFFIEIKKVIPSFN